MNQRVAKELTALTRGTVLRKVPLSRHTSLKVGGCADMMIYPATPEEVRAIIRLCTGRAIPHCVMGAGTNLLVRDGGIRGVVIRLTRSFRKITLVRPDGDQPMLQAEAGASLRRLLAVCLDKELAGLREALQRDGIAAVGEPQWARYNSPFSLPFMRRNEIWLEIDQSVTKENP